MPIIPFCIYTLIGATMWNSLLLYLGYKFHENLDRIKHYSKPLDYAFVAVLSARGVCVLHASSEEAGGGAVGAEAHRDVEAAVAAAERDDR